MTTRTRKPGKSWTHCRGIQEQFVEKILSGEKTTTIRPDAKNMQAGDRIKFYTGWRKKEPIYQVTVDVVKEPQGITLSEDKVIIEGHWYTNDSPQFDGEIRIHVENELYVRRLDALARKDGFDNYERMFEFFKKAYPFTKSCDENRSWFFYGKLITFANPRIEAK